MALRSANVCVVPLCILLAAGCTRENPPTVTPVPAGAATGRDIEIPIGPPPGGEAVPGGAVQVLPLVIGSTATYRDAGGRFSVDIPVGWPAMPQETTAADVRLGVLFPAPEGNGLLTVTQFDNGQRPTVLGSTANQVLELSGVTALPAFQELSRSNVIEREGDAMRIEVAYNRSDGVAMHSLVLFQIDNTTFSMVNFGVEAGSWAANEGTAYDILASYRVPALPVAP